MPPEKKLTHHPYFWLEAEGVALGLTAKAASTSISKALYKGVKRLSPKQVVEQNMRTRLYLRHPLERFASCWAYFTPHNNFPGDPVWRNAAYDFMREHPTIEQFTDALLDTEAANEHWYPQLLQHRAHGVEFDEVYRLENIADTFPSRFILRHENKGRIDKPPLMYRVDELIDYYREDYDLWQTLPS